MKPQRKREKLTLMIIPDASRSIVRFKLSPFSLYAVPAAALLVLTGSWLTVYELQAAHIRDSTALKEIHQDQEKALNETIMQKNAELDKLHSELIELSEQTEEFKLRLQEVKKLESSIQALTRGPISSTPPKEPASSSPKGGTGGTAGQVTGEQADLLVETTRSDLSALTDEMNALIGHLSDSKEQLAEADRLRRITPSIWPSSSRTVTSGFGLRLDPFTQKPAFHSGLDIAGKLGDSVFATADGLVRETGSDSSYGNFVRIDHGGGIETFYGHLSRILTEPGQQVAKGQKIALVGSTGRSTGPHLHYEVRRNRVEIDPVPFLKSK
ncbi:M23 family metallopeptidase [Paenibacillus hamazuiensis]|uniref:M23 family metallopeptidase n=1 Tax=Paenibacillus hamazuiensis TaxID=2936508 RepID=UPI00200F690E|nr:M23 family metallopeptidase [Paenibacillus hamazuiensis]